MLNREYITLDTKERNLEFRPIHKDGISIYCGNYSIDKYLTERAYYEHIRKISFVYLVYLDEEIIGFFSIKISKISLPLENDFESSNENDEFGALLLQNLAIRQGYQGHGFGSNVLEFLVGLVFGYGKSINLRFLILNAVKDKVDWYKKRNFLTVNKDELKDASPTVFMIMDFIDLDKIKEISEG